MKTILLCMVTLTAAGLLGQPAAPKPAQSKPKISLDQARKIALEREPGIVKSSELEKEKGRLIYSFDIKTSRGLHEVNVDALTGAIVEDKVESPADEAKEKKQDTKQKQKAKTP
ncbi:MAG: PepSY domain-containing protein [Terriglobales bacterium]